MKKEFKDVKRINEIDPAGPAERLCKLFEESGELAQVVNKSIGRKGKKVSKASEIKDHVCEEAADTIQCVFSLIDHYGISYDGLKEKLAQKNKKWESVSTRVQTELENTKCMVTDCFGFSPVFSPVRRTNSF